MTEYNNHFRPTGWLVPIMQWAKMAGRVNHQTEWFCLINGTRDAFGMVLYQHLKIKKNKLISF